MSADFAGADGDRAPLAEGRYDAHVLPDLDIAKGGFRASVEVKLKTEAPWYNVGQRYQHGIAWRLHKSYLARQKHTGTPVFLLVIERSTGALLFGRLDRLALNAQIDPRNLAEGGMEDGGMIFFGREDFAVIRRIEEPLFDFPVQLSIFGPNGGEA